MQVPSVLKARGNESAQIFRNRIREVFGEEFGNLPTYLSRPAVDDHPQNHSWDGAVNAIVEGLRDVLLLSWIDDEAEACHCLHWKRSLAMKMRWLVGPPSMSSGCVARAEQSLQKCNWPPPLDPRKHPRALPFTQRAVYASLLRQTRPQLLRRFVSCHRYPIMKIRSAS